MNQRRFPLVNDSNTSPYAFVCAREGHPSPSASPAIGLWCRSWPVATIRGYPGRSLGFCGLRRGSAKEKAPADEGEGVTNPILDAAFSRPAKVECDGSLLREPVNKTARRAAGLVFVPRCPSIKGCGSIKRPVNIILAASMLDDPSKCGDCDCSRPEPEHRPWRWSLSPCQRPATRQGKV